MGNTSELPWNAYLGERIRFHREQTRWTQERLVEEVWALWGLRWTRATVTAIESGKREVTARELVALFDVFKVGAKTFFEAPRDTNPLIKVADGATVSAKVVAAAIYPARTRFADGRDNPWVRRAFSDLDRARDIARLLEEIGITPSNEDIVRIARSAQNEAEKKAATKLGVDPWVVATWSFSLWKRSLTEERDSRIPDGGSSDRSLRTSRGHVTRGLLAELSESMERDAT